MGWIQLWIFPELHDFPSSLDNHKFPFVLFFSFSARHQCLQFLISVRSRNVLEISIAHHPSTVNTKMFHFQNEKSKLETGKSFFCFVEESVLPIHAYSSSFDSYIGIYGKQVMVFELETITQTRIRYRMKPFVYPTNVKSCANYTIEISNSNDIKLAHKHKELLLLFIECDCWW